MGQVGKCKEKPAPGRRTGSRLIRRRSAIATLCPDYSNLGDLRQEKNLLPEGRKKSCKFRVEPTGMSVKLEV